MRIAITLYLIIVCLFLGNAQADENSDEKKLFERKHYTAVWKYYNELLKKDSLNPDLNYKMGICYLNSRSQKAGAIHYFRKAITKDNRTTPPQTYKLLADAFYSAADYEAAIENYELYKRSLNETDKLDNPSIAETEAKINLCKVSKELRELKGSVAVFEMNKALAKDKNRSVIPGYTIPSSLSSVGSKQTKGSEPVIFDREFFEEQTTVTPLFDPESRKWDTSTVLMETTIGTSTDGQIILVYRNSNGDAELNTAVLNGNEWRDPERLDRSIINTNWEPYEYVTVDAKVLYFASDRPGGFGGMDIYRCTKQDNGEWSKAVNMGPNINSRFDEQAPFIHPDGVTLYFSSNRSRSNGYFDNFMTVFADSGSWRAPVNVGYPSYRSIEKKEKKDKVKIEKDNYIVTFNDKKKTAVTVMKRMITGKSGRMPSYTEVTVANNETGEIYGIYHPDPVTGKFGCIVPSEKNNSVTYEAEGFLFYSENINTSKASDFYTTGNTIELDPVETGAKTVMNNVFFENGKANILSSSDAELQRVLKLLQDCPKIKVEISTTLEIKSGYDEIKLAGDRLRSVLSYLNAKGIPKESLESRVYLRSAAKKRKKKNTKEIIFGKPELEIIHMN